MAERRATILLAPAAAGKTAHVLALARGLAGMSGTPRVVVASHLQVRSAWRRLAETGGALGVRVQTFDQLYADCLSAAGHAYTELSDPVQYRLIRVILEGLPLAHYRPLVNRPGFVQLLQQLIGELKAAMVWLEQLAAAVAGPGLGDEPRLSELALIYAAYQAHLQERHWADRAGLAWLAAQALAERTPDRGRDWPLLAVDGFDHLTPVQLEMVRILAGRVGQTVVTLTGPGPRPGPAAGVGPPPL